MYLFTYLPFSILLYFCQIVSAFLLSHFQVCLGGWWTVKCKCTYMYSMKLKRICTCVESLSYIEVVLQFCSKLEKMSNFRRYRCNSQVVSCTSHFRIYNGLIQLQKLYQTCLFVHVWFKILWRIHITFTLKAVYYAPNGPTGSPDSDLNRSVTGR